MWKAFIEKITKMRLKADFPLSTLSHISEGYSAGSIKRTCESILTEYRVSKLEERELTIKEFIGTLSICAYTDKEANDEFKAFTDIITGDKVRREKETKELEGEKMEQKDQTKKTGKKGKSKKK